jgi:hypothetical protein
MIEKLVEKDTCVLCGSSTEYDINCNINERKYYVEGAGQLCELCFAKIY